MQSALDDATPGLDATPGPDAATWTPTRDTAPPAVHTGRPVWMVYAPWRRSQHTDLGTTAVDAWHRRCRQPRCRIWAGPYADLLDVKANGTDHHHNAHTRPHVRNR